MAGGLAEAGGGFGAAGGTSGTGGGAGVNFMKPSWLKSTYKTHYGKN
jgi:hypothetical protein